MKIYFEAVLILNFLLDFMILYGTKRILKINKKLIRIVFGSIFGSFTTFLLLIDINNIELIIIKTIFSILIIIISFGINNILRNIFYFYVISIILGGSFYLLDFNKSIYLTYMIMIIFSFIIIYIIVHELINYKNNISNKYLVNIYYRNKLYKLEGFIDTGNRIVSPIDKKSVILTNLNIKSERIIYVPFVSLNNKGIIPCIRPDRVIINNIEFNNCLIALARDKFNLEENCILPNKFKEELC